MAYTRANTRRHRTEEEKLMSNVMHLKSLFRCRPEMCLGKFEFISSIGTNKKGLDYLGIHNDDDLERYINSQEA